MRAMLNNDQATVMSPPWLRGRLAMMTWPFFLCCVLNFFVGLLLQSGKPHALYPLTVGMAAGEILVLSIWIAWMECPLWASIGRIVLGYLFGGTLAIFWWFGLFHGELNWGRILLTSEAQYAAYSTFILLTMCTPLLWSIRLLCGWQISAGGQEIAMRFSLRHLAIFTAALCVFIAAWQRFTAHLRYWHVDIGIVLILVGAISSPLIVFAILRPTFRPSLLVASFVWTLSTAAFFFTTLTEGVFLEADVRSFLLVSLAVNLIPIVTMYMWRLVGYRLFMSRRACGVK